MANIFVNIVFVLLFVAVIVFVDVKYLRDNFLKRLVANVLIVIAALVIYFMFLVNL
jgi:hypothetical protein